MSLLPLETLVWNYWWSWAPDGAAIFRDLDPEVWEECEHNPRQLLEKISPYRLAEVASDPVYLERVDRIGKSFDAYMASKVVANSSITPEHPVAYFCAEFGVHNSLPLYSGGLGILAGDHLKSASDLTLPLDNTVAFHGPEPFEGWGIGGFYARRLTQQHPDWSPPRKKALRRGSGRDRRRAGGRSDTCRSAGSLQ